MSKCLFLLTYLPAQVVAGGIGGPAGTGQGVGGGGLPGHFQWSTDKIKNSNLSVYIITIN